MKRLYLDHNATCPLRPEARSSLWQCFEEGLAGNPSSAHADGRRARRWLEEARERLARCIDCERDELVFTSGGTESNAIALAFTPPGGAAACAPIEHPSVLAAVLRTGRPLALAIDSWGRVDPASIAAPSSTRAALVSVAAANHELGTLQDLPSLAAAAARADALFHVDASQAFGKEPLSFRASGADLMTLSAHKLGGPVGIGALIVRRSLASPARGGSAGGQEGGLRPGTEAAALAYAFAAAAETALRELPAAQPRWSGWTARLLEAMTDVEPHLVVNSPVDRVLSNTLNVSFPGRRGSVLVQRLDLLGVSASHGSACMSGSQRPSAVIAALGGPAERAEGALRISVGPSNTDADIAAFAERLATALRDVAVRAR